jgi:hypothetical protein
MNEITADPGEDEGANKSVSSLYVDATPSVIWRDGPTGTVKDGLISNITKSSSPEAGSPQESAEESPAAAAKAAAAVDESAEETALAKAKQLELARASLAYLKSKNT